MVGANTAPTDDKVGRELADLIARFEEDNPDLVRELDVLGMEVDEYVQALAEDDPQVTSSSSTASQV